MDEITILDKTYISSKRAAEITGYAKDYVGQLCREGHVDAKMVGRSWYVFEPSIRKHRFGEEVTTVPADVRPQHEDFDSVASVGATVPVAPTSTWEPSVYKAEPVDMIPELEVVEPAPLAPPASALARESINVIPQASYTSEQPSEDTRATLTDMQSAWREWFDKKQEVRIQAPEQLLEDEEPELMLPSAYDANELALEAPDAIEESRPDEFSVPIHRIETKEEPEIAKETEDEAEGDFEVPIQRIRPIPVAAPVSTRAVESKPVPVAQREGVIRKERIVKAGSRRSKQAGKRVRTNAPAVAVLIAVAMISLAIAAVGTGYAERYLSGHIGNNPVVNFLVGESNFKR